MIFEVRLHKKSRGTIEIISNDQVPVIENDSGDDDQDEELQQQETDKTFIENRDSQCQDLGFSWFVSLLTFAALAAAADHLFAQPRCATNTYRAEEGLCLDCLAPHGVACEACQDPKICLKCIDGWWLGREVARTGEGGALETQ